MKVSVLLPTWKREEKLKLALESLVCQSRQPDEVITIFRDIDPEAKEVIDSFKQRLPIKDKMVDVPGVIHAENTALELASGDIIFFLDDDAEAPIDWIKNALNHFASNPQVGGVGGPDLITEHYDPNYRKVVSQIGIVKPYGKIIGNHHHLAEGIKEVDVLKGVNMSFRREIFPKLDTNLQSNHREGNGSHWELDVCLAIKKKGYKLLFDPALDVRHNSNHSHFIHNKNIQNNARNLTYVILKHFSFANKIKFFLYIWFAGNTQIIGLAKLLHLCLRNGPIKAINDYFYSLKGHLKGILLYRKNL